MDRVRKDSSADYSPNTICLSGSRLPEATDPPCAGGGEGEVSKSRRVTLALGIGLGLLFTLKALAAVIHLYTNEQAKLHLMEKLHRNLSATLNTTDLIAGVEELLVKHKHLLTLQMSSDDTNEQAKLHLMEKLHRNLSATLNTTDLIAGVEELLVKHKHLLTLQMSSDATSGCRVCPDGWAHNSGKCYLFSSTRKTWSQSRDHCITLGGHLAIVNSQEEQNFLSQSAIEVFYWMGLSDLETEGQWIWVDSTPLSETGAVFWGKRSDGQDEPDNWKEEDPSGENCALFTKFGYWLDNSCKKRHTFVCETVATD
ncbi:asialoglycoprotein receptor 1-like isoform X2 [Clupea harengus]|uniref:Asialoglycoprotein receptor 1-like isoform X2 n=1 Tax=Clupea harengus TaxID=7950 RepID=A0A8M1KDR5_CLUHA|nr:asialoglycoprotein receptor 1-like isoform X2 [Clupea harengus]